MKKYEVVLFDFDGVLCHDRFYTKLYAQCPWTRDFVESQVFGRDSALSERWMRGEIGGGDINRLIAERTGVEFGRVTRLFDEGVSDMRVDARLIAVARRLADDGVRVGLVTNNMDVFSEVTVRRLCLDTIYSAIVNSSDYGCLKHDAGGRLFDVAMAELGYEGHYSRTLLVDDSAMVRAAFRQKGGDAFPFRHFDVFARWAEANLTPQSVPRAPAQS